MFRENLTGNFGFRKDILVKKKEITLMCGTIKPIRSLDVHRLHAMAVTALQRRGGGKIWCGKFRLPYLSLNKAVTTLEGRRWRVLSIMKTFWFDSNSTNHYFMGSRWMLTQIQIKACRLFGAKPLSKRRITVNSTLRNKFQWNLNRNSKIFFKKIWIWI